MDRPASLCWEGVALGWRENVPRPRSRGGDLVLQKDHHGPLHHLQRDQNGGLQSSHVVQSPSENQQPASLRMDSGLNSLEYWDYSVELECLSGPEDLQLAAELGKTLLERNKELESSLKQQQAVIDDQAQEIEYLNKQTTALREVNDSRLRIYEQLEISIAEMEKANSRLVEESVSDKARIKCLTMSTSQLEQRCEELQRAVEEARGQERVRRRRERRRSSQKEEGKGSRKASQETSGLDHSDPSERFAEEEVARLSGELEWLREETRHGDRKLEELQDQVALLVGENLSLSSNLELERRRAGRRERSSTVEEEMLALHPVSEGLLCRRCLGHTDPMSPQELISLGASRLLDKAGDSISTWTKEQWLSSNSPESNLIIFLSRLPPSPQWLDRMLAVTLVSTLVVGLLRAILGLGTWDLGTP